ncbi:hypothetical protein GE061_015372 [Apolygus lucorum]|uniref:Uncharacterized protein n=1 Tax=Apolygus lucorum TaxID=248454 RepID=A0A6A4JHF2_APOLU|nr:hypothetical protein GE061_015372 [Apolygus lucorum]
MHRSSEPHCQCFDQATALSVCVRTHSCSAETEEEATDSFRPTDAPLITKPTLIRMTRGHRNWMTHLPLSRPNDWTAQY